MKFENRTTINSNESPKYQIYSFFYENVEKYQLVYLIILLCVNWMVFEAIQILPFILDKMLGKESSLQKEF